jgi:hypothetical protein
MSRPETLQKKYVGKISRRALSFMKTLLNMDPADRPTSHMCLLSPYFEGLSSPNAAANAQVNYTALSCVVISAAFHALKLTHVLKCLSSVTDGVL